MVRSLDRRSFMAAAGSLSVGLFAGGSADAYTVWKEHSPVRFCLNTSCIREAKLPLPELVKLTAAAGYDGIEPWISEIDHYVKSGGKLSDLRKLLEDHQLQVESAIGFPNWAVAEADKRKAGFEEAKRGMELVRALGGKRIAAPPAGINRSDSPIIPLADIAERYHELLDLGLKEEVIPQVEIWGSSQNLSRLAEAVYVATAANHPQAAILPDIYHLYRGGSDFNGLRLLSAAAVQIFHVNDYPAEPAREQLNDSDRVYPGDGIAPLDIIFGSLKEIGFTGVLSLELFNRDYWKQEPYVVAETGLAKMKVAAQAAWNV